MNNLHGPFTFPPATLADDETGILGVGANWHPETLIDAYSKGIFPWPYPGAEGIPWFSPPLRAVLELKDYTPNKRLLRDIKLNFSFKANTEFSTVISHCKSIKRRKVKNIPNSSWITSEMEAAYIRLHELGIAHSVEVFSENHLVGGLYGVLANHIFSAESMFRLTNNASKASFHVLVYILKEMGLKYLDCQIISPHLSSWGVKEITRNDFLDLLNEDAKTTSEFPRGIININSV
jgi:leucyl/phenylalanyl-tRNA--protein transferase